MLENFEEKAPVNSMIVLTDDLEIDKADVLSVRLQEFTPTCRAYLECYKLKMSIKRPELGRKQLVIIPFANKCDEVNDDMHMLADTKASEKTMSLMSGDKSSHAGFTVTLCPSYKALTETVEWSAYSLRGDFARIMKQIKQDYPSHGFVVAEPVLSKSQTSAGGTIAWVWYGEQTIVPRTLHPLNVWIVNANAAGMRGARENVPMKDSDVDKERLEALLGSMSFYKPDAPDETKPLEIERVNTVATISLPNTQETLVAYELAAPTAVLEIKPPARNRGWTMILWILVIALVVVGACMLLRRGLK